MLNQIGQTWTEIVENSPTKNSYVDRNLINALKDRRLRQKEWLARNLKKLGKEYVKEEAE